MRVHVHNCVNEAGCRQSRGQSNRAVGGICSRKGQLGRRCTRPDDREILPRADPPGTETICQVRSDLPVQTSILTVPTKIGVTWGNGIGAAQVNLEIVRLDIAGVHVTAEELNLIGELVIQAEDMKSVFKGAAKFRRSPSVLFPSPIEVSLPWGIIPHNFAIVGLIPIPRGSHGRLRGWPLLSDPHTEGLNGIDVFAGLRLYEVRFPPWHTWFPLASALNPCAQSWNCSTPFRS